ncbi:ABC transporter permease [Gluconacetobacter johannae]|uniref:ABC transporter permease n=1 Tax=Gluconacetobacter johannae TaxID=112140 RepID=A0A7W4J9Y3_9PROT|nr:ABC transporter permease [Gluconacetobacter johannae]MBB2177363.1 ABC transporter permease [Gluconacetobacter johannae]
MIVPTEAPNRLESLVNTTDHGQPEWRLDSDASGTVIVLSGEWIAQDGRIPPFPADGLRQVKKGQGIAFRTDSLGRWDTALISFLWDVKQQATRAGLDLRADTLPDSARKLLDLLPEQAAPPPPPPHRRFAPVTAIGAHTLDSLTEIGTVTELGAETARGALAAATGRGRMRMTDLMSNVRDAGPSALLIVGIVNFLVGAILAFVGAVQLHKFAADIYVASLVGIAVVREMSAVMTAIIMAGRTGGAYAARIATMQGNEEIDALTVFGIPVSTYLILPSILSLILTMPFLYLYGCLIGILGGFCVAIGMLTVTGAGYFHQTINAIALNQFELGFIKSIFFAALIGLTSCRIGLRAGRSAADVGIAATRAVVVGIVGVIALDAIFAVIANTLGI